MNFLDLIVITLLAYWFIWRRPDEDIERIVDSPFLYITIGCLVLLGLACYEATIIVRLPENVVFFFRYCISTAFQILLLLCCRLRVVGSKSWFVRSWRGALVSIFLVRLALLGFSGL